jgi:Fe2+ transport system protein B
MKTTDVLVIGGSAAGMVAALTGKSTYPQKSFTLVKKQKEMMVPCGIPYIFGTLDSVDKNIMPVDNMMAKAGVESIVGEVISINKENKTVELAGGETIKYDKLMIATGSMPIKPKWLTGADRDNVFTIPKDKVYLEGMKEKLDSCKKVVVIGAGFIGVEFSDELAKRGHEVTGYLFMILILGGMFLAVFSFGNRLSEWLDSIFSGWHDLWEAAVGTSFWPALGWSAIESVLALIQIAFPYILPFYILLYLLEDWGYIARISFLMDKLMHKMGIHGKACISFIIGLGCNVPGCLSCRIMESKRERFITAVLVTLVPCSAVSVIVFGLVGKYVGLLWALGLYIFATVLIFIVGKISSKLMIGEPVELIMPMPDYKTPNIKTIFSQTWDSLKEFIYIAAPIVIVSGVVIQGINLAGWMPAIASVMSPVTVNWLGLPAVTGILLIFGILRKELILVMLAAYLGTTDFNEVLTSQQMITLAVVSMFYVPCVATISVLWKEYGWKKALVITFAETAFAIVLAGLVKRGLDVFMV